jgi:hypothetical protein
MNDEGSFGAGFALGFFLGLIGLAIAICTGNGKTIKGSAVGLIAIILLCGIFGFAIL